MSVKRKSIVVQRDVETNRKNEAVEEVCTYDQRRCKLPAGVNLFPRWDVEKVVVKGTAADCVYRLGTLGNRTVAVVELGVEKVQTADLVVPDDGDDGDDQQGDGFVPPHERWHRPPLVLQCRARNRMIGQAKPSDMKC
jgi:hypothetical protein